MRFVSIGSPAVSCLPNAEADAKAGFTLIEALLAAFMGVLGPQLFHGRRIMADGSERTAAQILLRSLVDTQLDRTRLGDSLQEGDSAGLHWQIATQLLSGDALRVSVPEELPPHEEPAPEPAKADGAAKPADAASASGSGDPAAATGPAAVHPKEDEVAKDWSPYRIIATVFWGEGHSVSAETIRLGTVAE